MVPPSCVLLATRRGVGHVEISPIAYVLQSLTIVVDAGAGGLLALAHIPLVADVTGREFSLLLLLTGLVALGARAAGRLSLTGLAFQMGAGSNEVLPICRELSSGQEALPVPPVIGILTQHEIHKLHQGLRWVWVVFELLLAELPIPQEVFQGHKTVIPIHREVGCASHGSQSELKLVDALHLNFLGVSILAG